MEKTRSFKNVLFPTSPFVWHHRGFLHLEQHVVGFPAGSAVKILLANSGNTGAVGLSPRSGRSSGGGNSNPLQYSCLRNPTDRGAWWAPVHRVAKSRTWLSMHARTHTTLILCSSVCWKLVFILNFMVKMLWFFLLSSVWICYSLEIQLCSFISVYMTF